MWDVSMKIEGETHKRLNMFKAAGNFKTQSDAILYLIMLQDCKDRSKNG